MALASVLLLVMIATGVVCLLASSAAAAWLLLGLSALWLPANNHRLEGPTLVELASEHGITVSDLAGVAGLLIAVWVLCRNAAAQARTRGAPAGPRVIATISCCAAVFALGAVGAYLTG